MQREWSRAFPETGEGFCARRVDGEHQSQARAQCLVGGALGGSEGQGFSCTWPHRSYTTSGKMALCFKAFFCFFPSSVK